VCKCQAKERSFSGCEFQLQQAQNNPKHIIPAKKTMFEATNQFLRRWNPGAVTFVKNSPTFFWFRHPLGCSHDSHHKKVTQTSTNLTGPASVATIWGAARCG